VKYICPKRSSALFVIKGLSYFMSYFSSYHSVIRYGITLGVILLIILEFLNYRKK
jgi:hypothetical protein